MKSIENTLVAVKMLKVFCLETPIERKFDYAINFLVLSVIIIIIIKILGS